MWDGEAANFDSEPDHGLGDPTVRTAWRNLLVGVLPAAPARVADLGCGTGTLSRLLTDEGYVVDGLDFSPEMVRRARAKVPEARFVIGDASDPGLEAGAYDAVLCRHVLWALPDPSRAIGVWTDLLKPGGVLVLVEGRWHTGGGLSADEVRRIVLTARTEAVVRPMPEPDFWGGEIADERYALVSRR